MASELWFYVTTVLICTGFALLMQNYSRWKVYWSVGFACFVIAGAVLTYFNAKENEEIRTKIGQLESDLENAKKEAEHQQSVAKDAAEEAYSLAQRLQAKNEEIRNELKQLPKVEGEIREVRLFPWQRQSGPKRPMDDVAATVGILVYAQIENQGSSTTLAHWELSIQFPDNRMVQAQKWPLQKKMQVSCEDGTISISKDEYLDISSRQALQKADERSGLTIWMLKNIPLHTLRTTGSIYTLTARDDAGVVHVLKKYTLVTVPRPCFGFDIVD